MVARGVLIDYKKWADENGIKYSPFEAKRISIEEIETVAKAQGVEFKFGDIFLIRSGFTEALSEMDGDEQAKALGTHKTCGVEGTEETAKWFWNQHFCAVAGDAIAFETIPPLINGKESSTKDLGKCSSFCLSYGSSTTDKDQFSTSTS